MSMNHRSSVSILPKDPEPPDLNSRPLTREEFEVMRRAEELADREKLRLIREESARHSQELRAADTVARKALPEIPPSEVLPPSCYAEAKQNTI